MEKKYNPSILLMGVALNFEFEGKEHDLVTNDELAKYEILIEIKDSIDKFRLRMFNDKLLLLRGKTVKNHDELEKNKDNLGAVVVNSVQKSPIKYSNYEDFWKKIGR